MLLSHRAACAQGADATRWLAEVEATDLADRMPRQLSGGQAQRVALARALAAEPDVLLLDEPMAGLDVGVAAAMRKLLRRVLVRDGRSALLITHDVLDVLTLADRVLILESGRDRRNRFHRNCFDCTPQPVRGAFRRREPSQRHDGCRRRADDAVGGCLARQCPEADTGRGPVRPWRCSHRRRSRYTATDRTAAPATHSR